MIIESCGSHRRWVRCGRALADCVSTIVIVTCEHLLRMVCSTSFNLVALFGRRVAPMDGAIITNVAQLAMVEPATQTETITCESAQNCANIIVGSCHSSPSFPVALCFFAAN
jgi:hypothetical protein